MTDIRIVQRGSPVEAVSLDWLLTPAGELDTAQELATAVTVALMTDARALPDDLLPDARQDDRRGWWGDTDALEIWDGWPIGSRLWLLSRAKITPRQAAEGSTLARIDALIREALEPLRQRRICSDIAVGVTRASSERVEATVTLYRGPLPAVELRYADLWNGILVSAPTD